MTSDQVSKAYNDHNVYILGAGFAQEAGLPLIKDFMNQMRDAAAWLEEHPRGWPIFVSDTQHGNVAAAEVRLVSFSAPGAAIAQRSLSP